MTSSDPRLVVTKYLDGVPVAWHCSVCGKAIRPAHDHVYVTGSEIEEAFRKHRKQQHGESN